jgi:hypothetical protein
MISSILGRLGTIAFACLCANDALAGAVTISPGQLVPGQPAIITYVPPAGATGPVYAHYGFDGWNKPLSGPGAGSEIDEGNRNYFARRPMQVSLASGQARLQISVPDGVRAMHMAFCWDECAAGDWDNNQGRDYSWSVVFPYIGPLLTWNANTAPDRGVVVTFETSWASTSWLKIWRDGQTPTLHQGAAAVLHRFQVTGLRPATRYNYQVGTPDGFVSAVHSFKTTSGASDKVSFVVFGDAQDNGENGRFATVADTILREHGDVDMVVSTGDLPWNDKPGDWWSFFDKGRALFASKVFMPVVGNHDTPLPGTHPDHTSFSRYFALPDTSSDRAFYRFDVGPARFFGMNSERPNELVSGGRQYQWLADQLRSRRTLQRQGGSQWTFVLWHVPPFNAGARHWRAQFHFRALSQLFDGIVDWQLSGHEHLGQRFKPLRHATTAPQILPSYGQNGDQGVGYLVVPGGGVTPEQRLVAPGVAGDVRGLLAYPTGLGSDVIDPYMGFARFDITGDELRLKTYAVASTLAGRRSAIKDQVSYSK